MYNNLLHSQYLYDAIYQDENAYQNLSYLDGGALSGQASTTLLGMPLSAIGTSINQTISNTLKSKKSSIFKFQN